MSDLKNRIENLSPSQRARFTSRLSECLAQRNDTDKRADSVGAKAQKLVSYVVPKPGQRPSVDALRGHLKETLPDYMVPAEIVLIEALPLTPNGKLDRQALPLPHRPQPGPPSPQENSRSGTEQTLVTIWADVLGLDHVGTHDNFFEIGGDSIQSIRIISKVRNAGITLKPSQLFEYPTIAKLAQLIDTGASNNTGASNQKTDHREASELIPVQKNEPVPLTPIQQWFFEQKMTAPAYWNMVRIYETSSKVDAVKLAVAFQQLTVHHDVLCLHFTETDTGWQQKYTSPNPSLLLSVEDLSSLPDTEIESTIESEANRIQAGLTLSNAPLLRSVLFDLGHERGQRVMIIAHHLIVDMISWGILLDDLTALYRQVEKNLAPSLPHKSTSFGEWAEAVSQYAKSPELSREIPYWMDTIDGPIGSLSPTQAVSYDEVLTNNNASQQEITVFLSEKETASLLKKAHVAYGTRVNELLMTALALALGEAASEATSEATGDADHLIYTEGHGREEISLDGAQLNADLSRSVGWFTTAYPVRLSIAPSADPADAIKAIKEQLRQIPQQGIGYGLLRYLNPDVEVRKKLSAHAPVEVLFNYLSQNNAIPTRDTLFVPLDLSVGTHRHPDNIRPFPIEVNAKIHSGQLELVWQYSTNLHEKKEVEAIAEHFVQSLRNLIAHCLRQKETDYTPSDFPFISLSQTSLDQVIGQQVIGQQVIGQIDSPSAFELYPCTPIQEGMIFHTLASPKPFMYFEQYSCLLHGRLDQKAFWAAWQSLSDRYGPLRTHFAWSDEDAEYVQVVPQHRLVKHGYRDLCAMVPNKQDAQVVKILEEDRLQGFDVAHGPLTRALLLKLDHEQHRLIWSFHHAILDGWSASIILNEFFALYEFYATHTSGATHSHTELAPVSPYGLYARWLGQQDRNYAKAYWQSLLQSFHTPTQLDGLQKNLVGEKNSPYLEQTIILGQAEAASIKQFAQQNQLTINAVVSGAWAILLHTYSGENDVVFGSVGSGRPAEIPGIERLVGNFLNTLPVRSQLDTTTPIAQWLHSLQTQQITSREFEYSRLTDIIQWSDLAPGAALFDTMVLFENHPRDDAMLVGSQALRASDIVTFEQTNLPLTLVVLPHDDLPLVARYEHEAFSDDDIEQLLNHLQHILRQMVADPQQIAGQISLLSDQERQMQLVEWNQTQFEYPSTPLHELFDAQVQKTPDAVAFITASTPASHDLSESMDRDLQVTYAELYARANQLAHYLREVGINKGDRIGVYLPRSIDAVVALLAILKAGGVYLALDPTYPQERLSFMLDDAQARFVVTKESLSNSLSNQTAQMICLDKLAEALANQPTTSSQLSLAPDELAYIIYTSGSTGHPKGTLVAHKQILNRLHWMWREYPFAPNEMSCQKTALGFVDSLWELLGPLLSGSPTVILPDEVSGDPFLLIDALERYRVTRLWVVPTLLHMLLNSLADQENADQENADQENAGRENAGRENAGRENALPHLRFVVASGETLPTVLYHQFQQQMPHSTLYNLYGTSEVWDATWYVPNTVPTSVQNPVPNAVSNSATTSEHEQLLSVPIGKPIDNVETYILNEFLQPVPIGITGELYVGGVGLADGYLNQPALTATKFIPRPAFIPSAIGDQGPLYRSGDLARYLPDGNIEFVGRADQQVKIRGFRVELGEIEAALMTHVHVGQAVAVFYGETDGDKRIIAYVETSAQPPPSPDDLQNHLRQTLPDYMIPAGFVLLGAFPLTPSGKVDRLALPAPDQASSATSIEYVAPKSAIEKTLAAIWRDVLQVEKIGIHDNFFGLGGHSLKATQVVSRIRDLFQIELPLSRFFDKPTITGVGEQIQTIQWVKESESLNTPAARTEDGEEGEI